MHPMTNLAQHIFSDETIVSGSFRHEDITSVTAKNFSANELTFQRVSFSQAKLERTSFSDIEMSQCDLITTQCADASWRRVHITGSRCNGVQLQTGTFKDVTFSDCKLTMANFRFSKLTNVRFKNCSLDEADFYAATLTNVTFQNCSLTKTIFSDTKLKNVDLRSSDVLSISGIPSLKGAIIDSMQLVSLAPILALELGLIVSDD